MPTIGRTTICLRLCCNNSMITQNKIKVLGGGGVGEETLFQKGPSPNSLPR